MTSSNPNTDMDIHSLTALVSDICAGADERSDTKIKEEIAYIKLKGN